MPMLFSGVMAGRHFIYTSKGIANLRRDTEASLSEDMHSVDSE